MRNVTSVQADATEIFLPINMTITRKPIILICIDFYLPGYRGGGPTRTIANLVEWLGDDFHFWVLTKDRDLGESHPYLSIEPGRWYQVGKAQVRYLSPQEQNPLAISKLLKETPHDLLYLNSVFSNFTVFSLLLIRLKRIPRKTTLLAARGNLNSDAMNIKSPKKQTYLFPARLLRLYSLCHWHAASEHEASDICRVLGQQHKSRIQIIPNLPTAITDAEKVKIYDKLPGEARIVFLSRISKMKNITFFLESLYTIQGRIQVDIWGPIEDNVYWEYCQIVIQNLPSTITVDYKGTVAPSDITKTLRGYHLFYLPTLGENFGHVILEALCAGCPVLISDRTPWKNLQEHGVGWALSLEQPEGFQRALQQIIDADEQTIQAMAERAQNYGHNYVSASESIGQMKAYLLWLITS